MLASGLHLDSGIDPGAVLDVTLEPGQMSFHHERIVHGSEPNRSGDKRIGYAVRYVAPDVVQGLAHHPVILARGRDDSGFYEHLTEPPGDVLGDCLVRQRALVEVIRRRRFGPEGRAGHSG
jgi:hypothetical protein